MEFLEMMKDPNLRWETMHRKYGLIFRPHKYDFYGEERVIPYCTTMTADLGSRNLRAELSSFIDFFSSKDDAYFKDEIDDVIEMIDKIQDGTWGLNGADIRGDHQNLFITEINNVLRLDLEDGHAYFGEESYGWPELPKIPLTDLKKIFEEWIEFRASVYGIKK